MQQKDLKKSDQKQRYIKKIFQKIHKSNKKTIFPMRKQAKAEQTRTRNCRQGLAKIQLFAAGNHNDDQNSHKKARAVVVTGMYPSNWVAATILPRRSWSLSMGLLQVLHDDRPDLAYSAFHGFGGFAIAGDSIQRSSRAEAPKGLRSVSSSEGLFHSLREIPDMSSFIRERPSEPAARVGGKWSPTRV